MSLRFLGRDFAGVLEQQAGARAGDGGRRVFALAVVIFDGLEAGAVLRSLMGRI